MDHTGFERRAWRQAAQRGFRVMGCQVVGDRPGIAEAQGNARQTRGLVKAEDCALGVDQSDG